LAKSFAKKAGQDQREIRLTLKFPADAPGVKEACSAIAEQATRLCDEVHVKLALQLMPLSDQQMRAALHNRDYELAYHSWDYPDDNFWLWPLFDPHADALGPGGSNFLGYDNDAKLQNLLRSAMSHRQFSTVRELQHSIHVHIYERVPLIPLWQLPENLAIHSSLTAPGIDPQRVFTNVLEWQVHP
jgi:ABC-type oligopeptide transport system substrate-binding subunit